MIQTCCEQEQAEEPVPLSETERALVYDALAKNQDQAMAEALQLASLKESVAPCQPLEGKVFDTLCDSQVARQLQMQAFNASYIDESKKQEPEEKEAIDCEEPLYQKEDSDASGIFEEEGHSEAGSEKDPSERDDSDSDSSYEPLSQAEQELISDALAKNQDQAMAEALQLASLKESVAPGQPLEGKVFDTLCDSQVARQLQMQVYYEEEKKKPIKEEPEEKVDEEVEAPSCEELKLDTVSQEIVDLVTECFNERFNTVFDPELRAKLEAEEAETAQ